MSALRLRHTLPAAGMALAALLPGAGCRSRQDRAQAEHDAVEAIQKSDSVPVIAKQIVRAVADSDAPAFARLVDYPLERPYPLPDVADEHAMISYYPVLVDDSLHRVVTTSPPSAWSQLGWRGWTLLDGRYLWVDQSVYSVSYVSGRERVMLDSLVRLELASLAPSLRGDWIPVMCLRAVGGTAVYRIDLAKGAHKGPAYRLAKFTSPAVMRQAPALTMTGYVAVEGSSGIATYHFRACDGETVSYTPFPADGSQPTLDATLPSGRDTAIAVSPSRWLDLLPKQ